MAARFRIRTPGGQEISFASHEMFEDFVRSGDLSPDDMVYDGDTGSWSRARTHPIVLEIQYEKEAAEEAAAVTDEPSPDEGAADEPSPHQATADEESASGEEGGGRDSDRDVGGDLNLDLAPVEERSPEEAKRAFMEKMKAERESDPSSRGVEGLKMEDESFLRSMMQKAASPSRPPDSPPRAPEAPEQASDPPRKSGAPSRPEDATPTSPEVSAETGKLKKESAETTAEAKQASAEPMKPIAEPMKPTAEPMKPAAEPKQPTAKPTKPTAKPTKPTPKPADASAEPKEEKPNATKEKGGTLPKKGAKPPKKSAKPPKKERKKKPKDRAKPRSGRSEAHARESKSKPKLAGFRRLLGAVARFFLLGVLLLLAGAGALLGYRALVTSDPGIEGEADASEVSIEPMQPIEVEPPPPPPAREPVIASTEAAIRERAQERFLTATQSELRELESIPEIWPEGPYLVMPSNYPQVVDVWQGYLSTIRRVRAGDANRYRTAYEAALDDAVIEAENRPPRLAAALSDFAASASLREAHYDRVEALATAAIQSHNALLEAEGLLFFDTPARADGPSAIGEGTSARDGESRMLLNQVVSLLEGALDADGAGPRSAGNVREWVWSGSLDAATR